LKHFRARHDKCPVRRPRAGAWIETRRLTACKQPSQVAPARGRGLKHYFISPKVKKRGRPRAGAWIETGGIKLGHQVVESPPRGGVD